MTAVPAADLARGMPGVVIWGVPVVALSISAHLGGVYPTIVWPLALTFMGSMCLWNARRCGRLHCYFTGPFFLLLAVASLLYGLGILALGKHGWSDLSLVLLAGAVLLICIPEWFFGKYPRTPTAS